MAKTRSGGHKLQERKALQTLQPSVDDEQVLVGKRGSVQPKVTIKKNLPLISTTLISKVDVDGNSRQEMPNCEGSPKIARRSQRKRGEIVSSSTLCENVVPNAATATKNRSSNNENLLKPATKSKSLKAKNKSVKTNKSKSKKSALKSDSLVQSTIEFPSLPSNQPDQSEHFSISPDLEYLVTDDTPEHYWKEVAEQRQAALDETLKENESLRDQLAVLQAENAAILSWVNNFEKSLEDFNKQITDLTDDSD